MFRQLVVQSASYTGRVPSTRLAQPDSRTAWPLANALNWRTTVHLIQGIVLGWMLTSGVALACWSDAATRHGVPAELLVAIARTESGMDVKAMHRNQDRAGSYDIGLMQINSRHLPTLRGYGIDEQSLSDPCVNLHVGAWILSDLWRRLGPGWTAVGAYNASCTQLRGTDCAQARARYAWRVYRNLDGIRAADLRRAFPQHGSNR